MESLDKNSSLQYKLTSAYLWNLVGRWGVRLVGIISTLFLVRLLSPESFGIIATATIYIGFFETLSALGVKRYLIAHTNLADRDLNSAWTLSIFIRLVVSFIIISLAGTISSFVNEPELELVIIIITLAGFLRTFCNIGLVKLEKDVNFSSIAKLDIVVKVFTAIITVIAAYLYPTYWALVIGSCLGIILNVVGSYVICDYIPKFDFKFKREMIFNSIWLLIRGVFGYLKNRSDIFLVSSFFGSYYVGQYKIAQDFATLPSNEVIGPASIGIFPAFSHFRNNRERVYFNTYKILALIYSIIVPSVFGMFIVADQFVSVILGEQWQYLTPILGPLSIMMILYPIRSLSYNIFDFFGKTKMSVLLDVISFVLLCITFYYAYASSNINNLIEFTHFRVAIDVVIFFVTSLFVKYTLGFSLRVVAISILVPFVSSVIMLVAFNFIYISHDNSLVGLVTNVFLGCVYYAFSFFTIVFFIGGYSTVWGFWKDKILSLLSQVFYMAKGTKA